MKLQRDSQLFDLIDQAYQRLSPCYLCPRACGAHRLKGETGECGATDKVWVASAFLHFGEEPPITGYRGSGTVFFSGCNLHCLFCQNADISHQLTGKPLSPEALASLFLELQGLGAHNINWVTPTIYAPFLMEALTIARENGLTLPVVYNCGGYESIPILRLLEPFVDIYMPDAKFARREGAYRYCQAPNYPWMNRKCLAVMYQQKGPLQLNRRGVAFKGVLVRHLVMPNDVAGTREVLTMIKEVAPGAYVSLMRQYQPCHRAHEYPEINRFVTSEEFALAVAHFKKLKLNGYIQ